MSQNYTRNRDDSRNSGNTKLALGVLERAVSFPIHVHLAFLSPSTRRFHAEPKACGLLDHGPVVYGRSCSRHLSVEHGSLGRP